MSEYAVNRQTGEVLKRDESGSWQKVKSAKNASGEILINEGGGWGAVPSAQPTAPTKPVSVLGSTIPGAQASPAPVSVMGSPITGLPEEELRRRQLLEQAQQAAARQADAERKARISPVKKAADEAARAAEQRYRETAPFPDRTDRMMYKDAARQQVYNEANVVSPSDAFTGQSANALALGIPAIANKDFRGFLAQAEGDQPLSSLGGQAIGFLAPAAAGWSATARGVNALVRPFIPRGADTGSRLARYSGPIAGQTVGAGVTNAGYQAAVAEPIRAERAGEDLTLGGMASAAMRGLTDPLNAAPAVLSGVNRAWNLATSGIATPSARAADMANRYGVGPRQTAASQGIAQTTQQLGGQVQPGDIAGFANIENMLRFALRNNPNIPDVDARIATGFQRIRQSLPLEDDPTLNLARLIEREFAEDAPQTRDIIRRFLLKVGMDTPGGGQIVGSAANQMRGQQTDILRTELESSLGAQPKTEAEAALQQSLDQFSEAYNNVMPQAPRTGPQAEEALNLLVGSRTNQLPPETNLQAILYRRAQERNMTVDNYILQNPLEALHWVQSSLGERARGLRAAGTPDTSLEAVVRNMQQPLRQSIPEYGQLQDLWRQYSQAMARLGYTRGAEAGVQGELTRVPGFGEKIFGPAGVSKSEEGTQKAADLFLQMDELSQNAAGLSVRDVINDELRKSRAAGLEQRYESAANISKVATEGGLDALRRVFGETGDRIARRIEQFIDASEFARNIDPEFNSATMNKAQAMATGAQPFAGPMGQSAQAIDNTLSQSMLADAALLMTGAPPILSIMRAPGIAARKLQPSQGTQRNIAQTLLRRGEIGSQAPTPPQGPGPITPFDPANLPGRAAPIAGGTPPAGGAPPAPGTPIPPATPPRTVGASPAAAATTTPPTRTQGASTVLAQSLMGGAGGSALGSRTDLNGDGVIDEQDVFLGSAAGTVGVPAAMRAGRTVGRPRGTETRAMGAGGPETPQQAARFETPGSPEYEAAIAKGLDMSTPARMARRKQWEAESHQEVKGQDWYHGTTHDFDSFSPTGNPENHHGGGAYFSSSPDDVARNYAVPDGPDLTSRIERRAEQIAQELEDATKWEFPDKEVLRKYGVTRDKVIGRDQYGTPVLDRLAFQIAKKEIAGKTEGMTVRVAARAKNPVVVNGQTLAEQFGRKAHSPTKKSTFWEMNDGYDEALDEFGDPSGPAYDLIEAVRRRLDDAGMRDTDSLIGQLFEEASSNGGLYADDFERIIRNAEDMIDYELTPGQVIQDAYKALGHDGIVLRNAERQFANMGISPDTTHLVIFDPANIRSVNAAFDPDKAASPQLLAGFGKDLLTAGAAGATLGGAMIARDEVLNQPQDARLTSMAIDPARSPQIAPPQAPRPIDTAMRRVGNVANDAAASLYGQSEIRRIENAAARGRAREFETGQQMEQMRPPANASENAVARLYAPPPTEVSMEQADNPLFFGVESFDDLSPNDPLRDPWFRREMIKRSLRDQAYQKAQGRTVGTPKAENKERRTVGKSR